VHAGTRSRIVNIGSVIGRAITPGQPLAYSVGKAALHHLTRIMARTLAGAHINVNAIAPAAFETDMTREELTTRGKDFVHAIPVGRLGRPQDIAATAVFLAAPASEFITGHILPLDGGFGDL
jgi:NAD(P)-dependent dehydrogenase (short-subunit alcohol dehydrogenase family)